MPKKKKSVKRNSKSEKNNKSHPKHFAKVYWPYIPVLAIVTFGMLFGGVLPNSRQPQPATLAYASEMSRSVLLSGTNSQRTSNGLSALSINSKLNSSAQAKAQDMVNKDYWAHNSPNGDAPWVFFDAAGYIYTKAGENLAYGFTTSSDTIVGWMNSPSHRANILDSGYTEVGFGFVNSADFVGDGNQTVVVAHYGKPYSTPAPAPEPEPEPEPQPQSLNASESREVAQSQPVAEEAQDQEKEAAEEDEEEKDVEEDVEDEENIPVTTETPISPEKEPRNITRLQELTQGYAPWSALALSIASIAVVSIWLIKHAVLVKKFIRNGENFVAHHPVLDLVVVILVAVAVYLSQTSGIVL